MWEGKGGRRIGATVKGAKADPDLKTTPNLYGVVSHTKLLVLLSISMAK